MQRRQQKWDSSIPACGFGIEHVKEGRNEVIGALSQRSKTLSLLSIDPHWESQLLVEYSIYSRVLQVFIHALAKLRRFWMGNKFQENIDHHKFQSSLKEKQLQGGKQKWDSSILEVGFGIEHVKEGRN